MVGMSLSFQNVNLNFSIKPGLIFYNTLSQTINTTVVIGSMHDLRSPERVSAEAENNELQVYTCNVQMYWRVKREKGPIYVNCIVIQTKANSHDVFDIELTLCPPGYTLDLTYDNSNYSACVCNMEDILDCIGTSIVFRVSWRN